MIPSLNVTPPKEMDEYICDCCAREVFPWVNGMYALKDSPIKVTVGNSDYYGCSKECARILFMIHHQYAMREAK